MMSNPSYETNVSAPPNPSPYPEQKPHEESDPLTMPVGPAPCLGYGAAPAMPPQYQLYQGPPSQQSHQDIFVESQQDVFISPVQATSEPDYLRYSIFTMFCCFLPFGIVAVIYSIKTQESNRRGNYTAARKHSRLARTFGYAAVGAGLILWTLYIILTIIRFRNISD
ncbi:proline-rich transmembrane protein 1-like [Python bivittatus]|uniref:Proline-rich transmembrane protein 1-like n=1 Tax=Python bivittatus TaxID=176946 RepID=A0A9F5IYQ6_PYTBI|nr:proline-rich transmembrane protein 1-like [Python bivittatus]